MSSTESEYVTLYEAGLEASHLRALHRELTKDSTTALIRTNSSGANETSKNAKFHERIKHIRIKHHKIRELVDTQEIQVEWMRLRRQSWRHWNSKNASYLGTPNPHPAI